MDLCLAHSPIDGAEASRQIRLQTGCARHHPHLARRFETVIRASTHAFARPISSRAILPVLILMIRETAQGVTSQAHLICSCAARTADRRGAERSAPPSGRRRPPSFLQQDHLQPADGDSAQARPPRAKKELTHIFSAYGLGERRRRRIDAAHRSRLISGDFHAPAEKKAGRSSMRRAAAPAAPAQQRAPGFQHAEAPADIAHRRRVRVVQRPEALGDGGKLHQHLRHPSVNTYSGSIENFASANAAPASAA